MQSFWQNFLLLHFFTKSSFQKRLGTPVETLYLSLQRWRNWSGTQRMLWMNVYERICMNVQCTVNNEENNKEWLRATKPLKKKKKKVFIVEISVKNIDYLTPKSRWTIFETLRFENEEYRSQEMSLKKKQICPRISHLPK